MKHPVQWQTPEPLWSRFESTDETSFASDQFRPAILRFATDDFMEQMLGTLSRDPAHLSNLLARPETWRTPSNNNEKDMVERVAMPRLVQKAARYFNMLGSKPTIPPIESVSSIKEKKQEREIALKLYQPAHQRYYLVSASLICRIAGLPDRAMVQGGSEQIGFVLRRIIPPAGSNSTNANEAANYEFAFVKDAKGIRWQKVGDGENAARMVAGEELLPLFPLNYQDTLNHKRTLWTGLVPVGRREEYMGAIVDRTLALSLTEAQLQSVQPPATSAAMGTDITARMTQFKMEVAEPWKNLIRSAYKEAASLAETKNKKDKLESKKDKTEDEETELKDIKDNIDKRIRTLNMQWQMQSWLILLDFADFLACYLPDVWAAINNETDDGLSNEQSQRLYDWLSNAKMPNTMLFPSGVNTQTVDSLRTALNNIVSARNGLENAEILYSSKNANAAESKWPKFHFLLAGLDDKIEIAGAFKALETLAKPTEDEIEKDLLNDPQVNTNSDKDTDNQTSNTNTTPNGSLEAEKLDRLTVLIVRALDKQKPEVDAPDPPLALQLSKTLSKTLKENPGDAGWFVIRYVYIKQECGSLHPPTVSEPTQRFQLASFFDPDAPARPIRISLPMDTTPAGIRKHSKNTAFIISDVLCGQIQRAKGLGLGDLVRSVLPWPLHKDLELGDGGACNNGNGVSIGMICSLSIPIITICALILLMIMVSLLDFIFRWLPYFIICFPVPKLKGKG